MDANRLRDAAAVLEVDSAYRRDAAIMREAADEVERLCHDIERHVEIACELATEIDRLRAELAECRAFMNRYAVHQITCNRNPCTCGFDSSWPETRRGEGE